MSEDILGQQRENWGSRAGFVLAAIGSAVGLGNLWAFPYKVYSHGGGAFLIPYIIAMLLIGIPVLILEFSLGHMTQRAAPDAYRGVNRKTEPIGWWGVLLGFVIITYYPVILAYCGSYLVECFKGIFCNGGELAWKNLGLEGVKSHFLNDYLQVWSDDSGVSPWTFGKLVSPIAISLAAMWLLMYFCIFRGVKMVSKVVLLTVPLPWIMLFILTVRGLTLPGAAGGLNFYLDPDFSELAKPETWRWAFGQMFFSMSLAFGVMITYASFLHRKSDLNNNATIIGLADVATSFVAGAAVFATLGAMAYATGQAGRAVAVTDVVAGGPGLAFVAFPYALAQLPYSAWFGAIFFIALLTLGIDSAFSITETVLASLVDKTGWGRGKTLIGMTVIGFGMGLVYCTRGGLSWLGTMDDFINSGWGGIALLGLLECLAIGWAYRLKKLRQHANERSDWQLGPWWDIIIRYVAPLTLSVLFAWSLLDKCSSPGGFLYSADGVFQIPALAGLIIALAAPIISVGISIIHSPGADLHAAHVGQQRAGRAAGIIATLLGLAAAVMLARGFVLAMDAAGQAMPTLEILGQSVPPVNIVLAGSILASLLAVVIGAGVVMYCENNSRRPSGFARFAAAVGIMATGCGLGVFLAMLVRGHGLGESVATAAEPVDMEHLTMPSVVVLAGMMTLLVVGLGWCFYRAIRAAGGPAEAEQISEGLGEN